MYSARKGPIRPVTSHSSPHSKGGACPQELQINQEPRLHPGCCPLCFGSRPRALVTSVLMPSQGDSLGEKALCHRGPGTLTNPHPPTENQLHTGPREQRTLPPTYLAVKAQPAPPAGRVVPQGWGGGLRTGGGSNLGPATSPLWEVS